MVSYRYKVNSVCARACRFWLTFWVKFCASSSAAQHTEHTHTRSDVDA